VADRRLERLLLLLGLALIGAGAQTARATVEVP
jgi:hypothetical protein